MNPSDAAELLAYCAAFDNRTVGTVDARAWAAALNDVPLDGDARAAVARFYGTPPEKGDRLWMQPHHVRSGRAEIRQQRLGTTLPAYEPPTELETGAEYVARRRAQLDSVAAGRAQGRPVGRLTGGPAPAVVEGMAAIRERQGLAAIGREVPKVTAAEPAVDVDQVRRPGAMGVACPACQAPIGRPCRNEFRGKRRELPKPHAARVRVAQGGPAEVESAEDIERRREEYLARLARMAGAAS